MVHGRHASWRSNRELSKEPKGYLQSSTAEWSYHGPGAMLLHHNTVASELKALDLELPLGQHQEMQTHDIR